jgi:hypothetical protein
MRFVLKGEGKMEDRMDRMELDDKDESLSLSLTYKDSIRVHYYAKKNQKISDDQLAPSTYYEEEFHFNLPEVLKDDFFFRHQLTLKDYEKILSGSKKISHLWALALFKQVEIPATSVNTCFMRNVSSNLGGNNKQLWLALVRKMRCQLQLMNRPEIFRWTPKIVCPQDTCVPPLPVHFVSELELRRFPRPSTCYSHLSSFALDSLPPIECVPSAYYHGYLQMTRLESKTSYEKRFGFPKSLADLPQEFVVANRVFYAVEESFLLQTPEAHQEMCENNDVVLSSLDRVCLWQDREGFTLSHVK